MQVGLIGGLGLTLPSFLRMEAEAAQKHYESKEGVAKSIIHIFLPGGMAQQESWDPKPYAPTEYRGPLGTIKTKVAGQRFGEHFKNLAQIADKITVISSMTHGEAAHERGIHNMFTGYRPCPALELPVLGQRRLPRVRPPQQPASLRLRSQTSPTSSPTPATSARPSAPSASATTPPTKGSQVRDLSCRMARRQALRPPPLAARHRR